MMEHFYPWTPTGNESNHHEFDLTKITIQQQILTKFQQAGIGTSCLQAAFQNGNKTAAMEWMMSYITPRKDQMKPIYHDIQPATR